MKPLAVALLGVLVIISAVVLYQMPDPPHLEVRTIDGEVWAHWTSAPDAMAYQIQVRLLGEDWQTLLLVWDGNMTTWASPPGVAEYRIRAWNRKGPGPWSRPTRPAFHLPDDEPEPRRTACASW